MNWQQKLQENITDAKGLAPYLKLTNESIERLDKLLEKYPMSITSYYLSLIDFNEENDPIKNMCIPSIYETDLDGSFDTSGEMENTVIVGMQHKYKQTAMILTSNQCAMYCRHCFRKRLVGLSDNEIAKHIDEMVGYIKEHKEISNVLLTGGDSFMNSNTLIERYLKEMTSIEHLDFIRFGTRLPVVFPDRITDDEELLNILEKYNKIKQIYIVTQYNHPRELTEKSLQAIEKLKKLGIVIRNQTVLLKGVNDKPEVLGELLKLLTKNGIAPYYIFQCRPVTGVKNQFQVPFEEGYDIVEKAKAIQNGFGKGVKYALSHKTGKIEIIGRNEKGEMIFKYHQAKYDKDMGRIFTKKLRSDECWLE